MFSSCVCTFLLEARMRCQSRGGKARRAALLCSYAPGEKGEDRCNAGQCRQAATTIDEAIRQLLEQ
jgi:hypothetical protein